MKVKVEAGFFLTINAPTVYAAKRIVEDLRIKNPQTSETIAPEWVKGWDIKAGLASVDPVGAAVVRTDSGPKRK